MSMRRPRIKAAANLIQPTKRKARAEIKSDLSDNSATKVEQLEEIESINESEIAPNNDAQIAIQANVVGENSGCEQKAGNINAEVIEEDSTILPAAIVQNLPDIDNNSFKFPQKVDYSHLSQNSVTDDVFHSDIEEQAIQNDMQKCVNGSMSPSKVPARQRIRATPIFGQRRNSFVGLQSSGDDTSSVDFAVPTNYRRERHYSASHSQMSPYAAASFYHHTPHKYMPAIGVGRIRTESGCSAFSDTYAASTKSRKVDENNSRLTTRRDFESRFTNGVPDKATLKMFDLIYYNPITNPMEQKPNVAKIKKEDDDSKECVKEIKPKMEKIETVSASTQPVPQLKLNSNGELILDDKSLEIETTAEQEARKVLANSSLIFLDENTGNNGFYKRQKRTKEWIPDETIKFYRCLQTIGTDFSLMVQLFPNRNRRDLKLKFKKEERYNGALINKALLHPKTFNIDELTRQLETEELERSESERQWKELKSKTVKKIKNVSIRGSAAARALKLGDEIYENENLIKTKGRKKGVIAVPDSEKISLPPSTNEQADAEKPASKRKRKIKNNDVCPKSPKIKAEVIKAEQSLSQTASTCIKNSTTNSTETDRYENMYESRQLENVLTDLLHTEVDSGNTNDSVITSGILPTGECYDTLENFIDSTAHEKTLVNLDDGTVSLVSKTATTEQTLSGQELDENDIQKILTELAEGSLVLVSTLDQDNADKVLNEIYMLDKITGELCDEPLEIPYDMIQCILSVIS